MNSCGLMDCIMQSTTIFLITILQAKFRDTSQTVSLSRLLGLLFEFRCRTRWLLLDAADVERGTFSSSRVNPLPNLFLLLYLTVCPLTTGFKDPDTGLGNSLAAFTRRAARNQPWNPAVLLYSIPESRTFADRHTTSMTGTFVWESHFSLSQMQLHFVCSFEILYHFMVLLYLTAFVFLSHQVNNVSNRLAWRARWGAHQRPFCASWLADWTRSSPWTAISSWNAGWGSRCCASPSWKKPCNKWQNPLSAASLRSLLPPVLFVYLPLYVTEAVSRLIVRTPCMVQSNLCPNWLMRRPPRWRVVISIEVTSKDESLPVAGGSAELTG